MDSLNYHHLRYFWAVAREGGVMRASRSLHISQPTVSAQVRALEDALGEKLLARVGRSVQLTDVGRVVYRYADEIFGLGGELLDVVKGRAAGRAPRFTVGIANVVPKLVAHRLLEPALALPTPVHVVCREDRPDRLLADLAVHALDLVLTDAPVPPGLGVRVYNHLLGECTASVFGDAKLAAAHRAGFPRSLDGAPFLLPTEGTTLRRSLDGWFAAQGIRPRVVGEFEDTALMKVFGEAGRGLFAAPSVIGSDVVGKGSVLRRVGVLGSVRERFYAISAERRLKHPAVVAISESARARLFA